MQFCVHCIANNNNEVVCVCSSKSHDLLDPTAAVPVVSSCLCCLVLLCVLQLGYGESQMLDKLLYDEEVKRCMMCFEQQFHYGVFYSYMKLREQVGP